MTPEEQMKIISEASAQGYKGSFTELIAQSEQQNAERQEQPIQEEQVPIPAAPQDLMSAPDFNITMPTNTNGGLVQSYGEPMGVGGFETGESVNNKVVYEPAEYEEGGFSDSSSHIVDNFINGNSYKLSDIKLEDFKPQKQPDLKSIIAARAKPTLITDVTPPDIEALTAQITGGNARKMFKKGGFKYEEGGNPELNLIPYQLHRPNLSDIVASSGYTGQTPIVPEVPIIEPQSETFNFNPNDFNPDYGEGSVQDNTEMSSFQVDENFEEKEQIAADKKYAEEQAQKNSFKGELRSTNKDNVRNMTANSFFANTLDGGYGGENIHNVLSDQENFETNLKNTSNASGITTMQYAAPMSGGTKVVTAGAKLVKPGINVGRTTALLTSKNAWKNMWQGKNVVTGEVMRNFKPSTLPYIGSAIDKVKKVTAPAAEGLGFLTDVAHLSMVPAFGEGVYEGGKEILYGDKVKGVEQFVGNATEFLSPKNTIFRGINNAHKWGKDIYKGNDASAFFRTLGGPRFKSLGTRFQNLAKFFRKSNKQTEFAPDTGHGYNLAEEYLPPSLMSYADNYYSDFATKTNQAAVKD